MQQVTTYLRLGFSKFSVVESTRIAESRPTSAQLAACVQVGRALHAA